MHIKYNKKLGGWEISRISDEEKEELIKVGVTVILESHAKVYTEEKLKEEISANEKKSRRSTKH
jgi:hypothetical protein